MDKYDYKKLTPFKWFVLENFPLIDEDFDALTNWQLFCKLGNEINKVINSQNDLGQQVVNLTDAFIALQDYVDNYFENLDVQEEIDNKLDDMVEDGTLQTIVNNYVSPILEDLTEQINNTKDQVDQATEDLNDLMDSVKTPMDELRKEYYNDYSYFSLPSGLNEFFDILKVYRSNDKQNFKVNLTKDDIKASTTVVKYVDNVNGSNSNDGSTELLAYKTLTYGLGQMAADTTFILLNDKYYRNELPDTGREINYNVNIIPKNGHCIMGTYDSLSWTHDQTYTNCYSTTRSGVNKGIDLRGAKNGAYSLLTKVTSLTDCNTTLNSYYTSGSNLYCNIGEEVTNDKVVFTLGISNPPWNVNSSSKAVTLYFENIDFLCGNKGNFNILGNTTYIPQLNMYNCKVLFNSDTGSDGISMRAAKGIFINCTCDRNVKDGFNYHANSDIPSYGIEINCIGSNNGYNSSDNYNNGSTAHDGSQVVRINGNYFNNKGGNVADVQDDTLTVNINCNAFDSASTAQDGSNTDFVAQQSGATMYLYNCYSKGSKSKYNLYAVAQDAYLYYDNCEFDTKQGEGVVELT